MPGHDFRRAVMGANMDNQLNGTVCGPVVQAGTISGPVTIHLSPGGALAEPADQLAQAVGARCRREEEQRRIHDPFPLPVRWQRAAENLTDHWENIRGATAGATSSPLALTGELDQVVDVYRTVPSGRLVILGRAGSGKTVLALRFVLDLLKTPRQHGRRAGDLQPRLVESRHRAGGLADPPTGA